ncbi:MAG TPA: hypothetical protein DCE23_04980 [Firmicutes bacterium]|nr:hypothetical protein [Bacillota bacterium]
MKRFVILIFLIIFLVISIYGAVRFFGNDGTPIDNMFRKEEYKEYKAGDAVKFNDSKWYVMYDSNKDSDYVTAISADLVTLDDEGIKYVVSGIYETSELNKYLKNDYVKMLGEDKLVEKNGYKVRLFNKDDLDVLLDTTYDKDNDEYTINNCPSYICQTNTHHATMIDTNSNVDLKNVYLNIDDIDDPLYDEYKLHLKYYNISSTYETYRLNSITDNVSLIIRPVINVYKNSLE